MSDHPSIAAGSSQCAIVLDLLQQAAGEWVSLTTLHVHSGSMAVHSRINDLRQRGHVIEHHNKRVKRMTHSFYRLPAPTPTEPSNPSPSSSPSSAPQRFASSPTQS